MLYRMLQFEEQTETKAFREILQILLLSLSLAGFQLYVALKVVGRSRESCHGASSQRKIQVCTNNPRQFCSL